MFQAIPIDWNMSIGAIEEASKERLTRTPSATDFSSWSWKPPAVPSRISECGEMLSGVPLRIIAARSSGVAGRLWQSRKSGPR